MRVSAGLKKIYDFRTLLSTFFASYNSICELTHFGNTIYAELDHFEPLQDVLP